MHDEVIYHCSNLFCMIQCLIISVHISPNRSVRLHSLKRAHGSDGVGLLNLQVQGTIEKKEFYWETEYETLKD